MSSVAAVIVSYADPEAAARAVASLRAQTRPPDTIVVVDNHPGAPLGAIEGARIVRTGMNLGYTGGANAGARAAGPAADWLLFLNPDAEAQPSCLQALLDAAEPADGLLGAQVLLPGGERVNAGDNPLHVSGLSWSGRYGELREDGPPREVAVVSGAALLARRAAWEQAGGMTEALFLYHDDVDLAWRVRLAGWSVRFVPRAAVVHDYEFDKGTRKWFYLERNRAWTVLTGYSGRTLVLLAPLLLATELAVLARAVRERWLGEKLAAYTAIVHGAPAIASRRREVQATRRVGDRALLERSAGSMRTALIESRLLARVNPWMERYRRLVLRAVR